MSSLLEKQHCFNCKKHAIGHHRVSNEQEMPRRTMPLQMLALVSSLSSFLLVRLERTMLR